MQKYSSTPLFTSTPTFTTASSAFAPISQPAQTSKTSTSVLQMSADRCPPSTPPTRESITTARPMSTTTTSGDTATTFGRFARLDALRRWSSPSAPDGRLAAKPQPTAPPPSVIPIEGNEVGDNESLGGFLSKLKGVDGDVSSGWRLF